MKKNMYIYPVSVLLAVGLLAGAAMPVQAVGLFPPPIQRPAPSLKS